GRTPVGIESTVVDCTTTPPTLLRPGTITRAELEAVVGSVQDPAPVTDAEAPATRAGTPASVAANRPAAITWSEAGRTAAADLHVHLHLDASPLAYAAELYAALHAVDDVGCATVLVEEVPMDPAWDGIRDRLTRAAHP
ncbi:MAG: Sua5 family C-terminal domain-containing protein, partial [Gemmatimonadota bacterium]